MLSEIARSLNDKIKLDRTLKRLSVNLQDFKEEYIYQIKENILNSVKNKITNRGTIENGSSINNISVIFA
ncbi:MAG: hypothetical protein LBU14_02655 [Candidatus Peribacteria bacterium]|jgi:hypothetical protein|nr:hypothetical protein [Candidatus Peribacteria bacterium]